MKNWKLFILVVVTLQIVQVSTQETYVQFATEFSETVKTRVYEILREASQYPVIDVAPTKQINYEYVTPGSYILSFGNTTEVNLYISQNEMNNVADEGFLLKTIQISQENNSPIQLLVCNGNSQQNGDPFTVHYNIGLYYCTYAILQELGFAFLHPLQPIIPSGISVINASHTVNYSNTEEPYWPIRGFHYHTEHPLELTECLNGMDSNGTAWADMIYEVELYYEWLIANKQNRLEWVLLWTEEWNELAWSELRQQRLTTLVSIGHQWALAIGADVPIAERQQHAWFMTGPSGDLQEQTAKIIRHVDWLMEVGYDYISTESGYSEFTHPNCTLMLEWMNITTDYVMNHFENKRIYIKCHCSSGQVCEEYIDPYTNEPINFNFLPAFANAELGVYAHTVQIYSFFQPAPSYGNQNFTYMLEFLLQQSAHREALFHGETAYWVNYDIDVPLFLPVYAANRYKDMRTIAKYEKMLNLKTKGQIDFTSGWEWSYWLNDVMTAKAAWNPNMQIEDDTDAFREALMTVFAPFNPTNPEMIADLTSTLIHVITTQEQLLIQGNWSGSPPSDIQKRNGIAYLEGWDTWAEFSSMLEQEDCVQPLRETFMEVRLPGSIDLPTLLNRTSSPPPDYATEVAPLLNSMQSNFSASLGELAAFLPSVTVEAMPFMEEIVDSMNITALRAIEVYALYQYVWGHFHRSSSWRDAEIETANQAISNAIEVVARRESSYRVPLNRIAGWRENPTSYHYGYLWPAHSLYYFWRDYSQATTVTLETIFPCFMNVINPADDAFGDGIVLNATYYLEDWFDAKGLYEIAGCFTFPIDEPQYPITPILNPSTDRKKEK